jgi:hypothetical protein
MTLNYMSLYALARRSQLGEIRNLPISAKNLCGTGDNISRGAVPGIRMIELERGGPIE